MRLVVTQLALPSFDQPVEVQIAGARGAPLVIALAGSRPTGEVPCWEEAAELLSDSGFQVALPDLHATPQTAPVALSTADAVKLVAECADALLAQYFCIIGWHWGASVAFNTARAWPQRMLRLVLAAPPISDPAIIRSLPGMFPVLLLWSARDAVVPLRLAQSFVTELGPRLTLSVSLDDGDAAIPPELLRAVHQFLSS